MSSPARLGPLRVALALLGVTCFALYPLMLVWPSGWAWHTTHSHYQMMIVGIYATVGVFLLLAARDPLAYRSFIWFAVWPSAVHGAVMAVEAIADVEQRAHLWGDVPALFVAALVIGLLVPRGKEGETLRQPVT
jgi:hypothetical protein